MIDILENIPLFTGMTKEQIKGWIDESKSRTVDYKKDEIIFRQGEVPKYLMLMLSGNVAICNDSALGKRSIVAVFNTVGEMFGEIFLFLKQKEYEHYALATSDVKILQIPSEYIFSNSNSEHHGKMINNMLKIIANKTYYLNKRVQILSCTNLRQKIAKMLLQNSDESGKVKINMNREELADFLNTARPSLSRELMKMQEEGLIEINKKNIHIKDYESMLDIL